MNEKRFLDSGIFVAFLNRRDRMLLEQLEGLKLFEATQEHHLRVCRMLDKFRGAGLTYVDASSLAFMEQHQIAHVWATDHRLGLTGAEVLPRS